MLLATFAPFRCASMPSLVHAGRCFSRRTFALYLIKGPRHPLRYRYCSSCPCAACSSTSAAHEVALAAPLGLGAVLLLKWRELRAGAILSAAMRCSDGRLFLATTAPYRRRNDTPFERWSAPTASASPRDGPRICPVRPRPQPHETSKNTYMNVDAIGIKPRRLGPGYARAHGRAPSCTVGGRRRPRLGPRSACSPRLLLYHAAGTPPARPYWSESMAFKFCSYARLGAARAASPPVPSFRLRSPTPAPRPPSGWPPWP